MSVWGDTISENHSLTKQEVTGGRCKNLGGGFGGRGTREGCCLILLNSVREEWEDCGRGGRGESLTQRIVVGGRRVGREGGSPD